MVPVLTAPPISMLLTALLTYSPSSQLVYVFVEIPHFARDEGRNPSKLYKSSHLQSSNTEISVMPVLTGNDLPNTALDSIQYYHHCLSKTLPREPRHSNTIIIVLHQITQMVIKVRGPNMRNYSLCLVDIEPHRLR